MPVNQLVSDSEDVARFVLRTKWIKQDKTLRHTAFMPHPHVDLSVTRKDKLPLQNLKNLGENVAKLREKILLGWANLNVSDISEQHLKTVAAPILDDPDPLLNNPHHANITGWPAEKSAQKSIAQQLAAQATFTATESVDA